MSADTSEEPAEPPLFTGDFALIVATQIAFCVAFASFFLLPKFVVTNLYGSPAQVGNVSALAVVAAVLASPLCGKLLDRGPRRPLIILGCLLSGLAAFAFLGVTRVGPYLYALRVVQGVSATLYFVAAGTLIADLSPPARLGQALGWFGSVGLVVNAVATIAAERIAQRFGWHAVFYTAGAAGLIGAALSLSFAEPGQHAGRLASNSAHFPVTSRVRVLWATAAGGAAFGAMFTFTQPLALALGETNISPLFVGYTTAALFVRLAFGNLADRFGRARIGAAALAFYSLIVAATAGLAAGWLSVVGVGFGLAHGAFYPSLNALALQGVGPGARGTAGAHFNAAFNAGTFVVTFCFGQVAQLYGYRVVFLLVAGLSATGCFALLGQARKSLLVRPS